MSGHGVRSSVVGVPLFRRVRDGYDLCDIIFYRSARKNNNDNSNNNTSRYRVADGVFTAAVRGGVGRHGGSFRGRRRIVSHSTDRSAAGGSRASQPPASRSGALKIDTQARCRRRVRPVLCWLHRHRRRRVSHRSAAGGGIGLQIIFSRSSRATRNNYYANAKRPTDRHYYYYYHYALSHIVYMLSL